MAFTYPKPFTFGSIAILIGGLEHVFPYTGNFLIPTDKLIFFRGVGKSPIREVGIPPISIYCYATWNQKGTAASPRRRGAPSYKLAKNKTQQLQFYEQWLRSTPVG